MSLVGDLHPDEGKARSENGPLVVRGEGTVREFRENPLRAKDGTILWVSTSAVPLFDGDGNFCGYRGMATDVTVHKERSWSGKQHAVSDEIATAGTLAEIVDAARGTRNADGHPEIRPCRV